MTTNDMEYDMRAKPSAEVLASQDLAQTLKAIPDKFLRCRDMRHYFVESLSLHVTGDSEDGAQVVERHSTCKRGGRGCGTTKREVYHLRSDRWEVLRLEWIRTDYDYPDGYLMPEFRKADHAREIMRVEAMQRASGARG